MSDKSPYLNQPSVKPFMHASKVTQTLFSEILSNQSQFMTSSLNQVMDHTAKLLNADEAQSVMEIQQNNIKQQRDQVTDFSQQLSTSFQKAQASYRDIFTTEVCKPVVKPTSEQPDKVKTASGKTKKAKPAPVKASKAKPAPVKANQAKPAPVKVSQAKPAPVKASQAKPELAKTSPVKQNLNKESITANNETKLAH
jgi:Phasin protein